MMPCLLSLSLSPTCVIIDGVYDVVKQIINILFRLLLLAPHLIIMILHYRLSSCLKYYTTQLTKTVQSGHNLLMLVNNLTAIKDVSKLDDTQLFIVFCCVFGFSCSWYFSVYFVILKCYFMTKFNRYTLFNQKSENVKTINFQKVQFIKILSREHCIQGSNYQF